MFTGALFNLQITLRVLTRGKAYTIINLIGLVLGLTASFLLFIFAINELSYNETYPNAGRTYRVICNDSKGIKGSLAPYRLKSNLKKKFLEIEETCRMVNLVHFTGTIRIKPQNTYREATDFICADPEILKIFSIHVIRGIGSGLLEKPNRIMISKNTQKEFFGEGNPIGKTLLINTNGQTYPLVIEGVFQDIPWNSTFKAKIITSISFYTRILQSLLPGTEEELKSGNDNTVETYVMFKPGISVTGIEQKIKLSPGSTETYLSSHGLSFQNLKRIYLNSNDIQNDFSLKGSKENLLIYLSLAFFILLLAGINYSMLSTARSALRFREIGMRKVLGATKRNLRSQLLTESIALTLLALPFVFILLGLINPFIGSIYGHEIILHADLMLVYLCIFSFLTISIGIVSGLYISVYLASLDLLTALKSNYFIPKRITLGKLLIVFQLIITLSLVTCLVVIFQQINFFLKREIGIEKENLLMIYFNSDENLNIQQFENELNSSSFIKNYTGVSINIPDMGSSTTTIKIPGNPKRKVPFEIFFTGKDFFKTMGIKLLIGREFLASDTIPGFNPVIINEEALKLMYLEHPINTKIGKYTIVGVSNDFNIHSLHRKINPTIVVYNPDIVQTIIIRYQAGNENQLLEIVKNIYQKIAPAFTLDYKFFDQEMNTLYLKEKNFGYVVGSFTLLAFIITGMGLFGMAMLIAERRMKEMSIRKVFGVSEIRIIYLMQKDFLLYVILASLIAVPLSWFVLSYWLNEFYYRIIIQWNIFVFSILTVGLFVGLILFIKTFRILQENPANALKYE